eukprot:scaffold19864_cov101-Isochrysis_galbana.AAC.1
MDRAPHGLKDTGGAAVCRGLSVFVTPPLAVRSSSQSRATCSRHKKLGCCYNYTAERGSKNGRFARSRSNFRQNARSQSNFAKSQTNRLRFAFFSSEIWRSFRLRFGLTGMFN